MIGIFDSGLGGLTALKEIKKLLPGEDLVYFGDTGRVPYGTRSRETIIKYATQDAEFLKGKGVDLIIAACGTVSTNVPLDELEKKTGVPVIGVVVPAAEAAVRATKNKKIAVIGTAATVGSGAFEKEIEKLDDTASVTQKACPLLVPLVENGYTARDCEVTRLVLKEYLAPVKESGADTLVLGCTHYPILSEVIADLLPGVSLISTGAETARKVASMRNGKAGGKAGEVRYFVSDDPDSFNKNATLFLGEPLPVKAEKTDVSGI